MSKDKEITIKLKEFQRVAAYAVHKITGDDIGKCVEYAILISIIADNLFDDKERDNINNLYKRIKKEHPEADEWAKSQAIKHLETLFGG